jgi:hypothetical protein
MTRLKLLPQINSLRKVVLINIKEVFIEVRWIKRKILKREGSFHGEEDWDLSSQRKRTWWKLILH